MNILKLAVPLLLAGVAFVAWRQWGWPGLAMAGGGVVMWALLHITRVLAVLGRAAHRPVGTVASAVMLHAKLKPGMALMHVLAMTRALGALRSPVGEQPEVYCWADAGGSAVTCTFVGGKLREWTLARPQQADAT